MCKQGLQKNILGSESTIEVRLNQNLTEFDGTPSIKAKPKVKANDSKKSIKRFCCTICSETVHL